MHNGENRNGLKSSEAYFTAGIALSTRYQAAEKSAAQALLEALNSPAAPQAPKLQGYGH